MKKLFLLVLVLFSAPVFCMESGQKNSQQKCIEDIIRTLNSDNATFNHNQFQFVMQAPSTDQNWSNRAVNAWNGGVDQVIAQIPMLIVSVLINEMMNGFPACSKISSILSKKSYRNDEADVLTPQFETIQNTDVTIKLLKQLISNLEDVMDPDNPEQQTKLEELKRCKQEHINALFDESLKFTELMKQSKTASAAA